MELSILSKLRKGVRFDFATLAESFDDTEAFWEEWWTERDFGSISRPEVIENDDPILAETVTKEVVDLLTYRERFNEYIIKLIDKNLLPARDGVSRADFRKHLLRIVGSNSMASHERPQIVFAGGGYGSGKTSTIWKLAKDGRLPVGPGHMVGVDYFKLHVPEFSLIHSVADGRASSTVQKECKMLADSLFPILLQDRRSFVWDSSMSNREETLRRIGDAQAAGYELTMVAVLAPLKVATRQAMERALESRRFPNLNALPESNRAFKLAFPEYVPEFDEVIVFARNHNLGEDPVQVAVKSGKENPLVPVDSALFTQALTF
jgi:hypothetical protein